MRRMAYKQAIVDSGAADIVYSDLFTGVHGNYLRSSIVNAGLDPDNLAAGSLDTMKFGSDGSDKSKAWRDIWGSGQGIGAVDRVRPAAEYRRICSPSNMPQRRRGSALADLTRALAASFGGISTGRREVRSTSTWTNSPCGSRLLCSATKTPMR